MSFSETIFLFFIALLVFGPKKLPEIGRQVGKILNDFKRASNEFRSQIESEISQIDRDNERKKREENMLGPKPANTNYGEILPPSEAPIGTIAATPSSVAPHSPVTTADSTMAKAPDA
jgi:sec-independent protein translocase protein TatB